MYLIGKIKKKGLSGCMHSVKYRIIKIYNNILLSYYAKLPIDEFSIILESEGDCCDNAYALFDYMRRNGYIGKYHVTWLVDHPENYHDDENVVYVKKNIYENFCKKTIKALRACKWYIYDHNNLMDLFGCKEAQTIIYLGHGLRNKKSKAKVKVNADYIITTGEQTKIAHKELDGFSVDNILTLGYPRLDYFTQITKNKIEEVKKEFGYTEYKNIFLWMPTFRESKNKVLSLEYNNCETSISCVPKWRDFELLNQHLNRSNTLLVLKVHHLQKGLEIFTKHYSNIKFLSDEEIKKKGVQLYEFIPITDALITDYSSIFVDYLLLDKPMVFTLDDMKEYEDNRGLWPDNYVDYLVGYHTYSIDQFICAINDICDGKDIYRNERRATTAQFHSYTNGSASQRIVEYFNL